MYLSEIAECEEQFPLVYDFRVTSQSIFIDFHPVAFELLRREKHKLQRWVNVLNLGLPTFLLSDSVFGVGGVFVRSKTESIDVSYSVELSLISDRELWPMHRILATLYAVGQVLGFRQFEKSEFARSDDKDQLLSLDLGLGDLGLGTRPGSFNFQVEFSSEMRRWAVENLTRYTNDIHQAMLAVYQLVFPKTDFGFGISVVDQGIHGWYLEVPGSATSIVAGPEKSSGYKIIGLHGASNNCDSETQELALLCGIGRMCQLLRTEN